MFQPNDFIKPDNNYDKHARTRPRSFYAQYGKRIADIIVVFFMLIMIAPMVLVIALIVRHDGSSAFYGQPRLGRGGKVFMCWKLRSMQPDANRLLQELLARDSAAAAEWARDQKLKNDPRITSIGRILRKFSLDELPQLWNVFRGDMSLVGPRPMMPEQMSLYPGRSYLLLRPGLTGFWQVSDRSASSFAARAGHDNLYLVKISLFTDIRVLLQTILVVIRGTGI